SYVYSFNMPATTEIYTLSLHDALPISRGTARSADGAGGGSGGSRAGDRGRDAIRAPARGAGVPGRAAGRRGDRLGSSPSARGCRSEEHTSELQSRFDLVCRLLLEKKNK